MTKMKAGTRKVSKLNTSQRSPQKKPLPGRTFHSPWSKIVLQNQDSIAINRIPHSAGELDQI